ncbi:LysR family transcriptional regulator [Variovorax paradoxus]|uniref:LysR family transcriptional regulator n=1 Tax=Variovorax paradoxus TaxID=34073 RepID=A0A6I6HEM3_VARPD|nr:LysR family transcriptional regulator [Variovorax paradoxus]
MLNQIDLSRVDLNLLVLFEAVLQEGHVGRAAQRMNLTPSAVSHGLGRLRHLLNDPLFLRTPKGVVPTERASELAAPIAEVLARVRSVVASAEPFDPSTSTRRFTIGAPDGVSAVLLPALLPRLQSAAPGVALSVRQLLPAAGETLPGPAWRPAYEQLESRVLDIAVVPTPDVPARFHRRFLYEEDFVVALRSGHPQARHLSLERYCALQHLMVSNTGDPHGFVDTVLAEHGRTRRAALTVPNFAFALMLVADTDYACMLPRRFARLHAQRHDVLLLEPPVPFSSFRMHLVVPEAAMRDEGLAWLVGMLEAADYAPGKTRSSPGNAAGRKARTTRTPPSG